VLVPRVALGFLELHNALLHKRLAARVVSTREQAKGAKAAHDFFNVLRGLERGLDVLPNDLGLVFARHRGKRAVAVKNDTGPLHSQARAHVQRQPRPRARPSARTSCRMYNVRLPLVSALLALDSFDLGSLGGLGTLVLGGLDPPGEPGGAAGTEGEPAAAGGASPGAAGLLSLVVLTRLGGGGAVAGVAGGGGTGGKPAASSEGEAGLTAEGGSALPSGFLTMSAAKEAGQRALIKRSRGGRPR